MARLLEKTPAGRRQRKAIALTLLAVAIILLLVTVAWWISLPDEDPGPMIEDVGDEVSRLDTTQLDTAAALGSV